MARLLVAGTSVHDGPGEARLRRLGRSLPPTHEQRLLNALAREQVGDGGYPLGGSQVADPFATALAVETLTHLRSDTAREIEHRVGAALLSQRDDGGWAGDFQLRMPPPDQRDPRLVGEWTRGGGGGASFVLDRDGLLATAQACAALSAWVTPVDRRTPLPEVPQSHATELDVMEAVAPVAELS